MFAKLLRFSAVAAMVSLAVPAFAADRHVDIVNKTGQTLKHFYASAAGVDSWEEDILGRDVIEDGETFNIDIDDGSGACKYDFKAVFDNGSSSTRNNINVCQVSSFTYR